jgi:hypothetical protein
MHLNSFILFISPGIQLEITSYESVPLKDDSVPHSGFSCKILHIMFYEKSVSKARDSSFHCASFGMTCGF